MSLFSNSPNQIPSVSAMGGPVSKVSVIGDGSKRARMRASGLSIISTAVFLIALGAMSASAFAQSPYLHVSASAVPTVIPPGGEGQVLVRVTNLSDKTIEGSVEPVVITDKLPAGLIATAITSYGIPDDFQSRELMSCPAPPTSAPQCTWSEAIAPYGVLEMTIAVKAELPPGTVPNEATVTGGQTTTATVKAPITVSSEAPQFQLEQFALTPENEDGTVDEQAGSHPFQLTTAVSLNTTIEGGIERPVAMPKDLKVNVPPGLVGDAPAIPQCSIVEFDRKARFGNGCRADTAVGVADVTVTGLSHFGGPEPVTQPEPIFNLTPAPGEPARFGFIAVAIPVVLDAHVRTSSDYGVSVESNNILETAGLTASLVTLWGVPSDPRHDDARGWGCLYPTSDIEPCLSADQLALPEQEPAPFLTLPTQCKSPLEASAEAESWSAPNTPAQKTHALTVTLPSNTGAALALKGCEGLPFKPSISVLPQTQEGSTPTGLNVDLHMPQESTLNATGQAEADLKATTVALPEGMQLSPSSANGLQACSEGDPGGVGFTGFREFEAGTSTATFTGTLPERWETGQDFCPNGSKVGLVHIKTPLLSHELEGGVYLAAQNANPFGSLVALYIVAQDPESGVLVKLAGEVHLDEHTGRLVSTFNNTPQLPFEDLELEFFGGPTGPVTTPPACGMYTTNASFTPWSGEAPVSSTSSFPISSGPNGSPCANPLPFTPTLTAGSANLQASIFTPFTMTMSREDGNQNLSAVQLHMPEGLLGKLASVTPCQEPQAAQGTCGSESLIGHTVASVGLGPDPYTISGGQVFITGPYKGAPYGLSIAQPAKAGPFDLGSGPCDCVVVRAKIEIDPHTSALTITSDPLPTILQGIPVQLKHVNVTVDRPGFTFNPTNCSELAITATITSEQGATAPATVPFEVANCATLPFKPKFTVLTQGRTSKANGAALHVKVTSGPGQANIGKVKVDLPKQLPSRLTTLQKACPDATFNANPASCPLGSVVGTATAVTPVLKNPLTGPAYLVSHAGAAFPDLVVVLQGEGITLDLVGNTDIKKGITISNFNSVPDAPISTFDLVLPEGPHSALTAFGNLCNATKTVSVRKLLARRVHGRTVHVLRTVKRVVSQPLSMPTALTGQNGAVIKQTTKIAVSGCPKHVRHVRKKNHRKKK